MIVIVDYGMGNVGAIANMGRRVGGEMIISGDPEIILRAQKLILPGVGAFDSGMRNLSGRGLIDVLNKAVLTNHTPILGICLGMQLLTEGSEEGSASGIGWIKANTIRFRPNGHQMSFKVPHMGWNFIEPTRDDPLFASLPPSPRFYFVHSYHLVCKNTEDVLAWTEYGNRFASAIQHGNIWGTQFHPEKSHKFGLAMLRNFIALPNVS